MAKAMSGKQITTPSAQDLADAAKSARGNGLPPVHLWDPPFLGDMDMRIARDGNWIHEGGRINRPALVRLFSTILKREGDSYYLVTPVEKFGITVEDAPFVAVDVEAEGTGKEQRIRFVTNVGDHVVADAENPIRVERDENGEPSPYVHVRAGLEALIDRKSFYRLMELGEEHDGWFGIWSSGVFFRVIPADALPES